MLGAAVLGRVGTWLLKPCRWEEAGSAGTVLHQDGLWGAQANCCRQAAAQKAGEVNRKRVDPVLSE